MSSKAIANPLMTLIAQAAKAPRETGEAERLRARHRDGGTQVILCDISGSMAEQAGARTRFHHLREALNQVMTPAHVVLAFASSVNQIRRADDLPAPSGGTALEMAIEAAAKHNPAATLVISDGEPNDPQAALAAAARLPGRINVIYCGDESNVEAVEFMRRLARLGGGRVVVHRWAAQTTTPIAQTMRLMLAGPA